MAHFVTLRALVVALAIAPVLGVAADAAGDIEVIGPYARAVPPVVPNSAAFLRLKNLSDGDRQLVAARSDAAQAVELHTHINDNGVMRMRQVKAIDIPAHSIIELKPGGLHIMLLGLRQPLQAGEQIDLTLEFADGSSESLRIPVQDIRSGGATAAAHQHHH